MPAPDASMEPGHEDREYVTGATACHACWMPQWSPVMKTGNTLQGPGAGDKTWGCLNGARS